MNGINKIIIGGSFWDSYIYSNRLLLFYTDGSLCSYDWEKLVMSRIENNDRDKLAYRCAFIEGTYLYNQSKELFEDIDIVNVFREKFNRTKTLIFNSRDIERYTTGDTIELSMLPTDIGIYNNELFYCNSDGLYKRKLAYSSIFNYIQEEETKIWDGVAQCLKVGYGGSIALSASSDGLFQYNQRYYNPYADNLTNDGVDYSNTIIQVSSEHSSYCSWSYSSLFTGSYLFSPTLFGLKYVRDETDDSRRLRLFGEFGEDDIFSEKRPNSIIVSGNDKIYRISQETIEAVKYQQNNLDTDRNIFKTLDQKSLEITEKIIHAEVVEFGVIIETKTQLYVLMSTGEMVKLVENPQDEMVGWRIFARSKNYLNQLHIIFHDRIEIVSFNEDYLVNQNKKLFGQRILNISWLK